MKSRMIKQRVMDIPAGCNVIFQFLNTFLVFLNLSYFLLDFGLR